VLQQALDNVKPVVEVKSRRVGGATYQVPVEVRANRRQTSPCVGSSKRPPHAAKVHGSSPCAELMEAAENRGAAVRKREDTHRMAEANKAFAALPLVVAPPLVIRRRGLIKRVCWATVGSPGFLLQRSRSEH